MAPQARLVSLAKPRVNWENSLVEGLQAVIVPTSSGLINVVNGDTGAVTGSPTFRVGRFGNEVKDSSTDRTQFTLPPNNNLTSGFTLAALAECDDTSTSNWLATLNDSAGNLAGSIEWRGDLVVKRPEVSVANGYGSPSGASSTTYPYVAGTYYVLGALCSASNVAQLAYNQIYSAATISRANRANINNLVVGNNYTGISPSKGGIVLLAYWDEILSAQEWADFAADPFQIIRQPQRLFKAAAGSSISASVAVTLADTSASINALAGVLASFGVTLADAIAAISAGPIIGVSVGATLADSAADIQVTIGSGTTASVAAQLDNAVAAFVAGPITGVSIGVVLADSSVDIQILAGAIGAVAVQLDSTTASIFGTLPSSGTTAWLILKRRRRYN